MFRCTHFAIGGVDSLRQSYIPNIREDCVNDFKLFAAVVIPEELGLFHSKREHFPTFSTCEIAASGKTLIHLF